MMGLRCGMPVGEGRPRWKPGSHCPASWEILACPWRGGRRLRGSSPGNVLKGGGLALSSGPIRQPPAPASLSKSGELCKAQRKNGEPRHSSLSGGARRALPTTAFPTTARYDYLLLVQSSNRWWSGRGRWTGSSSYSSSRSTRSSSSSKSSRSSSSSSSSSSKSSSSSSSSSS